MSLLIFFGQAAASTTGALAATETGSDSAALFGTLAIAGALSASESGSDIALLNCTDGVIGYLGATEVGADTGVLTGAVEISAVLPASETGSDVALINGTDGILGYLAASEFWADSAAIDASSPQPAVETSQGAGSGKIRRDVHTHRPANEVDRWQDWRPKPKPFPRTGVFFASETGADSADCIARVAVAGSLAAQEAGVDRCYFRARQRHSAEMLRAVHELLFDMAA